MTAYGVATLQFGELTTEKGKTYGRASIIIPQNMINDLNFPLFKKTHSVVIRIEGKKLVIEEPPTQP